MNNEETTIHTFRKHWFILAVNLCLVCFSLIAPLWLLWYAITSGALSLIVSPSLGNFISVIWVIVVWSALFLIWTQYYLNVWYITDRRIIAIEQPVFFNRSVVSWEITSLQEVIASETGVLQNVFHFGTLEIRTAGTNDGNEHFYGIPHPERVRDIIIAQGSNFERLISSKKSKEELLHTVSHEVKGYLTKNQAALAGIVEGDYGEVPESVRTMAASALTETRRGVSTVIDILHGNNGITIEKTSCDIEQVVRDICEALRPQAEAKGLSYVTRIYPGEYTMQADTSKLGNIVFKNLVDNAIRYTPAGAVTIELSHEPQAVRFSVSDSGVGLSPGDMQKLFTDGGHGAHSKDINPESTGFGLAASKRIVDAHGGRMWAESEGEGKGSRFVVELPVA